MNKFASESIQNDLGSPMTSFDAETDLKPIIIIIIICKDTY